ncbi:MAG: hypothetical protein ACRECF_08610 [Methyloceanibacter sp.]
MIHAFSLLTFGYLLLRMPVILARRDGAVTEADLWIWFSRQGIERLVMLNALVGSGLYFALCGTMLLLGALA